jgi:radical SAM protein with 4Fe4S-binding SPASM domain
LLRRLEEPVLYNPEVDELYTLDEEALEFLTQLGEIKNLKGEQQDFIQYLESENLIEYTEKPQNISVKTSPIPSLRFLQLNITTRCNLNCHHCNLGKTPRSHMTPSIFEKVIEEFEELGGLKLIISGGEPLLHPDFFEYLEKLQQYSFRRVVLTNATLITRTTAEKLSKLVDEVQVSIDGTKQSHNILRGENTYERAMQGIQHLQQAGVNLSIATMIHTANLDDFKELNQIITELKPLRWSIDAPCIAGNLKDHSELMVSLEDAAEIMRTYGFTDTHQGLEGYTCGSHLCEVMPDGNVVRCSFFEESMGNLNTQTLRECWEAVCKHYLWHISALHCADCKVINECRGGCRYRAYTYGGILEPDPLQCKIHQITPPSA